MDDNDINDVFGGIDESIAEAQQKNDSLDRIIAKLPPADQAAIYRLAQELDIKPAGSQDLLYRLMVGLGYHAFLVAGTPDKITDNTELLLAAAERANSRFAATFNESQAALQRTNEQLCTEYKTAVSDGAKYIRNAARDGALKAIETADLSRFFNQVRDQAIKAAGGVTRQKTIVIASIATILIMTVAGTAGWFLKAATLPQGFEMAVHFAKHVRCDGRNKDFYRCVNQYNQIMDIPAVK